MQNEGKAPMIDVRVYDLMKIKFGDDERSWPTRDQLATKLGMQPATVTAWLKRRVDRVELVTLEKWCEYLEVTPGDILVRKN